MQFQSPHTRLVQKLLEWQQGQILEQSYSHQVIHNFNKYYDEQMKSQFFKYENGDMNEKQFILFLVKHMNINQLEVNLSTVKQKLPYQMNIDSINQYITAKHETQEKFIEHMLGRVQAVLDGFSRSFKNVIQQMFHHLFDFIQTKDQKYLFGIFKVYLRSLYIEKFDLYKYDDVLQKFTNVISENTQIFKPDNSESFLAYTHQLKLNQIQSLQGTHQQSQDDDLHILKLYHKDGDVYMIMKIILDTSESELFLSLLKVTKLEQNIGDSISNFFKVMNETHKEVVTLMMQQMIQMMNIMTQCVVFECVKAIQHLYKWRDSLFSLDSNQTNTVIVNQQLSKIIFKNFIISEYQQNQLENFCLDSYDQFSIRVNKKKDTLNLWLRFLHTSQKLCLLHFNRKNELLFMSQKLSYDFKNAYKTNIKTQFKDQMTSILNNDMSKIIKNLPTTSLQQDFYYDNSLYHVTVQRSWAGKLQNTLVHLSDVVYVQQKMYINIVILSNKSELIKKFHRAVRIATILLMGTRAFRSKQQILQNYQNSTLVEFLPEKVLKRIMNLNEAKIMYHTRLIMNRTINNDAYQRDKVISKKRDVTKYDTMLKSLDSYKPTAGSFINLSYLNQKIEDVDFNIMELNSADEKVSFVWQVLQKCPLLQEFHVPFEEFSNFITLIRHDYNKRENPFHNFVHGATVMHGCYIFSQSEQVIKHLSPIHRFALVFSGLVHDVDHSGKTNLYEMNTRSKLATLYNDRSILEHHHLAKTYQILQCEKANIFCQFDNATKLEIKKFTINNILATDNKQHFSYLNRFEIKLKSYSEDPQTFDSEESKLLLSSVLVHSADFFGTVKPFSVAMEWSVKVCSEFTAQVVIKEIYGIPQTPYLKGLDQRDVMAKGEIGFIQFIVKPLWQIVDRFSKGLFKKQIENMEETLKQWNQILEEEEEKKKKIK